MSMRSVYFSMEDQAVLDEVLEMMDVWNDDCSRAALSYSSFGGRVACLTTNNPQDFEQAKASLSAIAGVVLFDFIMER